MPTATPSKPKALPPATPVDPHAAVAALVRAYLIQVAGTPPPTVPAAVATAFVAGCLPCARRLQQWLVGSGNSGTAVLYMERLHVHAVSGTLGRAPAPGQVGAVAVALGTLQQMADRAYYQASVII